MRQPPPEANAGVATMAAAMIGKRADAAHDLYELMRDALPLGSAFVCKNASEALNRLAAAVAQGAPPALFLIDARGDDVREVVFQIKELRQVHANTEIILVMDPAEGGWFHTCIQMTAAPEKLTLLMSPLHRQSGIELIRAVANRVRLAHEAQAAAGQSQAVSLDLNLEIQELRTRLEIAKHSARHDDLTGLINRAGFVEELTARLSRDHQRQTVMILDLDRFKSVNDTMGHAAGDELVRKICLAISSALSGLGVVSRLGGDEFGLLFENLSPQGLEIHCAKILQICSQSRLILGHEVQISASIGISRQGDRGNPVELMRQADLALYAAKREGKNRYRVFDDVLDAQTKHKTTIEQGLESALRANAFSMVYQPIVTAKDWKTVGFEALIRWNSQSHGAISPAEFIPIAEEIGLILDIGDWITRQALSQSRRWGGQYVSINLSAKQFLRHNVAERILRYAKEADVAANLIQVELTETAIIDDVERAAHNLRVLRDAGVRIALDDFGTGYSSLVYLKQFAIDCIKVDKSFVDNITRDRQSAMIVASVARLAGSLGMSVIAEGVETEDQRDVLLATGCTGMQGFLFGRPMTGGESVERITDEYGAGEAVA